MPVTNQDIINELEALLRQAKERPCQRCAGCGQIADSDSGEPWSAWTSLPAESRVAVRLGLVNPLTCPNCNDTSTITDPNLQAAWEYVVGLPVRYTGGGRPSGSVPETPVYQGRYVYDWPDGAVRGLLEQVVETIGYRFTVTLNRSDFDWWPTNEGHGVFAFHFQALMEAMKRITRLN